MCVGVGVGVGVGVWGVCVCVGGVCGGCMGVDGGMCGGVWGCMGVCVCFVHQLFDYLNHYLNHKYTKTHIGPSCYNSLSFTNLLVSLYCLTPLFRLFYHS